MSVIVRFPPSPTGPLHIGNVRTALYNYLFARKNGGQFIIRVEDTDKERSKKEYEEDMFLNMSWLNLRHDNKEIWRQSERTDVYKKYLDLLIKSGAAYISQEDTGTNREVVRFRNPGGKIKFNDLIRGDVEIDITDLGDFIIARNINEPVYHLAVVIDDMEAGITHIIRGEDHISNTPRHILIFNALNASVPIYAHLPMILATDKSKLSKRKHGESVSLRFYKEKGYEPEAIINFLALLGWNPGDDREIFTLDELVEAFDISKVQKKGAILNIEKLDWVNREHILRMSDEKKLESFKEQISKTKFANHELINDEIFIHKFLLIILDRIHRWGEVSEAIEAGEFDYLFMDPVLNLDLIKWKDEELEKAKENLQKIIELLKNNSEFEIVKKEIMEYAQTVGKGGVLWPLRASLSGREKSPDPFTLIDILGKEKTISRLNTVINAIDAKK